MAFAVQNMENHFRLNVEKKLFVKAPEQEDYELTPATRLLEKRREMIEVENGLNQQKDEFSMKMDSLRQRREELSRKEDQLKDSLMKFDKFLKENNVKRTRALKKSVEERKAKEQKESEIQYLKTNLGRLVDVRNKQSTSVEKNHVYQKYLEGILQSGEDFGEVKDILARYDTLTATNNELIERAHQAQEKAEQDRSDFNKSVQEKNNIILNCNNEIAKLQSKLEELQIKSTKLDAEADHTLKSASERTLLMGQIKMATNNLFNVVKGHLSNRMSNTTNPIVQLDRVQQFILDLDAIKMEMLKHE